MRTPSRRGDERNVAGRNILAPAVDLIVVIYGRDVSFLVHWIAVHSSQTSISRMADIQTIDFTNPTDM